MVSRAPRRKHVRHAPRDKVPPSALKRLRLNIRYRNLQAAHLKLLRVLSQKEALTDWLYRRASGAQPQG